MDRYHATHKILLRLYRSVSEPWHELIKRYGLDLASVVMAIVLVGVRLVSLPKIAHDVVDLRHVSHLSLELGLNV